MDNLTAARLTMALTLGFHIVFASVGIAMPFFMALSHWSYLKRNSALDLRLTKMWSKGVAIFFATGAVSGTVLSFELGLLWPEFMEVAGPVIGLPFAWEGTAFFLEAIALGIFLYGWGKLPPKLHWLAGLVVGISGVLSGIFVVSANGWMNAPTGFDWIGSRAVNIDPVKAMFNQAWFHQALHMTIAAFEAVGFAVAGIHAYLLLKNQNRKLNERAMRIALLFGTTAAVIQPFAGDLAAKWVAQHQPAKFAAMESLFQTQAYAPLLIGGLPDVEKKVHPFALEIPGALSFLAKGDFKSEVQGLDRVARENWPNVFVTHVAFQIMVGFGMVLFVVSLIVVYFNFRGRNYPRWLLRTIVFATPLGFLALEAGWVVTEVGRQPWVIYNYLRTQAAVTPKPGMVFHLVFFAAIYLALTVTVFFLMKRQIQAANREAA